MRKRCSWLSVLVMGVGLAACVNLNTYFPASATEKAADRIIEEVWDKEGTAPPVNAVPPPASQPGRPTPPPRGWGKVLDFLVTPVAAVEPDLEVSSPTIERIIASMSQRHTMLRPYFQSGAIGLTHDGLVAIREAQPIPFKEKGWLEKVVVAENSDRKALYRALAQVNRRPEWRQQIQKTFARRWIHKAPKEWWYQNAQGHWEQKE